MGDIKIENADVSSSHPLVIDVMSADDAVTEPAATHVLKFGDFVIVGALYNLVIVSAEEWAQRQAEAAAAAVEAQQQEIAEQHAPSALSAAATDHPAEASTEQAPAKLKRAELEAMTKDELDEVADDHDIDIPSHATKAEMVDAILKGQ